MAHGAGGMASGRIGVKSPFFPLVNFLEKNMGNLGLRAANLRSKKSLMKVEAWTVQIVQM